GSLLVCLVCLLRPRSLATLRLRRYRRESGRGRRGGRARSRASEFIPLREPRDAGGRGCSHGNRDTRCLHGGRSALPARSLCPDGSGRLGELARPPAPDAAPAPPVPPL